MLFIDKPATSGIYTLSLHDALPICSRGPARTCSGSCAAGSAGRITTSSASAIHACARGTRSEEHTSELQSHVNLVCRLLLEKKKNIMCTLCYLPFCDSSTPTIIRLE